MQEAAKELTKEIVAGVADSLVSDWANMSTASKLSVDQTPHLNPNPEDCRITTENGSNPCIAVVII